MIDLTTQLSNYALTCMGRAMACRREANSIRQEPTTNGAWPEYDRVLMSKAEAQVSLARIWDQRGAMAKQGFLLVTDPNGTDLEWRAAFSDLYAEASQASRLRFVEPTAAQ